MLSPPWLTILRLEKTCREQGGRSKVVAHGVEVRREHSRAFDDGDTRPGSPRVQNGPAGRIVVAYVDLVVEAGN